MKEKEPNSERRQQTTDTVVMIYPENFYFNPETAKTNKFMKPFPPGTTTEQITAWAKEEFNTAVKTLVDNGVNVIVINGPEPDAVFPNNWFSHHGDKLVLYPMANNSRSEERKQKENLLEALESAGFKHPEVVELFYHESVREMSDDVSVCIEALEGTGSLVLDRENKIAYAIESPRTSKKVFDEWCEIMGYEGVFFHASDNNGDPIYHTNVIMGIGNNFSIASLESIKDPDERVLVEKSLKASGRMLIDITLDQVESFCGNLLEVMSTSGDPLIVMSDLARENFTPEQLETLEKFGRIVSFNLFAIEHAGGSARCLMAEVYKS